MIWVAIGLVTLLAFAHVGVRAARLSGRPVARQRQLRVRRHWLPWNFSIDTPDGRSYDALAYSQAFDTSPPGCPYCNRAIRWLSQPFTIRDPNGREFEKAKRVGYVCVHCLLASPSDLCLRDGWRDTWVPIEEYRHEATQ